MGYEFLEHTADVKFRAFGDSPEDLFVFSVDALNDTIRGEIKILEQMEREILVEGKDLEELLYSFLEEFLVMLDSEGFLVARVKSIKIDSDDGRQGTEDRGGYGLRCVVVGDKAETYKFTNDVKAVRIQRWLCVRLYLTRKQETENRKRESGNVRLCWMFRKLFK